ncbi:unnamed protein product [Clavelina lepadiformis]|uniref:Uncharacterized protein n=1 Tax=Clavelina lepadiformis TaxID=159417 RepID=A0ABP0G4I2_CLALP
MDSSVYLKSIPFVCEDHETTVLKALYEQQQKSQLCDVSLIVENVNFSAHRAVLAACSTYFCALFEQRKQLDDAGSKVCNVTTIHLSSVNMNTFIPILHFLYTSRLHVFCENIQDVLRTARKLQISTIVKACERLMAENAVLPSIRDVKVKEPNDTVITQDNQTQSVLYVDLRSEDDEEYPSTASSTARNKRAEEAKPRVSRTQKKKGFPKKIEQPVSAASTMAANAPMQNITSVSPASIFGRVSTTQGQRSRSSFSPALPGVSSTECNTRLLNPNTSLALEPLPFENNLESLSSIFGNDSTLIIDSLHNENFVSSTIMDKGPTLASSSKSQDLLQLQSVFSMSPNLSASKCSQTQGEWLKLRDVESATMSSVSAASLTTLPQQPSSAVTISSFSVQTPGTNTPSVYTCKECFKYFTNLADAFHHFYSEHQSSSLPVPNKPNSNVSLLWTSNSHSCPHCGRIFNNKNNLKRHILIKHTSDKRFKCSVCGRRYAIRQSLQYHMNSVHGRVAEENKSLHQNAAGHCKGSSNKYNHLSSSIPESILSSTSQSYLEPGSVESIAISLNSCNNTPAANSTSSASFLTPVPLNSTMIADLAANSKALDKANDVEDINLPTIQRIESIRPVQQPSQRNEVKIVVVTNFAIHSYYISAFCVVIPFSAVNLFFIVALYMSSFCFSSSCLVIIIDF